LQGLNVLIVDDNTTNRRYLETLLTRWHTNHSSAESGEAALRMLEERPFDVVLLDVQMPQMDGFEVAARIRQRWPESTVKIALLTSMGQRGDAAQCRDLMIGAYLCKPLKTSDLFESIRRLCTPATGTPTESERDLITRHSLRESRGKPRFQRPLRILVAEDNRVNQALARRLLEKEGHTVTLAADGQEAIRAFDESTFDLILMDVQMPNVDGLEATAVIRSRELGRTRTPIIALTAHAMSSDRDRCLGAGMDAFVSKPIQVSELWDAMSSLCDEGFLTECVAEEPSYG
jgi:two-component system, sensor histidine kinase and response regulator